MKLMIRADANDFIATGHMMRCLSIADAAIDSGCQVLFVSADDGGRDIVQKRGFEYISLGTDWNKMDGELHQLSRQIHTFAPDYVLVDSYYVNDKYLSALRRLSKTVYIDDLNSFTYPCDVLICYANYYKKFMYDLKYTPETKLLLGCAYAPLRECFSEVIYKGVADEVRELLLLSGGADCFHFIKKFLAISDRKREKMKRIHITAVCGVYNEDFAELCKLYDRSENISVIQSVNNIEAYMERADLAISAAGTTLYELCACGVPTICYTLADNQLDNAISFKEDGIMLYSGDLRDDETIEKIFSSAVCLMEDTEERSCMSQRMRKLVDGYGAKRIVDELKKNI